MPYFDFHIHPTLKSLFSNPTKSPWDKLDTRTIPPLLRWCTDFPYILQSQANLNQLLNNECHLVCIALYAPEVNLMASDLILKQADGPLKEYLNHEKIQNIINGNPKPYDLMVKDDLETLLHPERFGITNKKIVPLKKASDYDPNSTDTIYVVFSVEGCHTLANTAKLANITKEEVIQNMDDLSTTIPVLAINLTHMEQSPLCNHAYGMQFLKSDFFKPTGRGLSSAGAEIVKHCYQNKIMIDVKHMSLTARQQLYNLRKGPAFTPINQPLICTHAGFTGISIAEIPDYIYKNENFSGEDFGLIYLGKPSLYCTSPRPSFNPSSINLFDEDIVEIVKSGGMIGLSLDKRILGYADPEGKQLAEQNTYPLEAEYFSLNERAIYFSKAEFAKAFDKNKCITNAEVEQAGPVNPLLGEYHLKHFMGHIIHLIKVAQRAHLDVDQVLKQVCIGSDFDGLINPIWICDTMDEMVYFREHFEKRFVSFAHDCSVTLPATFDIQTFSHQLFYKNGKDFVLKRLQEKNP